jgi:hypothetical protein
MHKTDLARRSIVAAALVLTSAVPAFAGPPLICHPFETGGAALLPWTPNATQWNAPDPAYDVSHLTTDTLRLLTPETPVLLRMETLRRATIYAASDPAVAADLLRALTARVQADAGHGAAPLAWFDAGYLIESYRQAASSFKHDLLAGAAKTPNLPDGYGMVMKALQLGGTPEMEFAASLMKSGDQSRAHLARAERGAVPGSLLARNLARP